MAWDHCPKAESFLKKGFENGIKKHVKRMKKMCKGRSSFDFVAIKRAMEAMKKKFEGVTFDLELVTRHVPKKYESKVLKTEVGFKIHDYGKGVVKASITIIKSVGLFN